MSKVPEGATHMRRPEYLTAWLYESGATIPEWLALVYVGHSITDQEIGRYACAIDGEFWRWIGADKFNEMYVAVDTAAEARVAALSLQMLQLTNERDDARARGT